MSVELIEDAFPGVTWTGGSQKHRSYAMEYFCPSRLAGRGSIAGHQAVAWLAGTGWHKFVYHKLLTMYPGVEWFLTREEYVKIVFRMSYLSYMGTQIKMKKGLVQNPVTGNVFIPFAKRGDIVLSLRFWFSPIEGGFWIGNRVRIEVHADSESERKRSRALFDDLEQVAANIEGVSGQEEELALLISEPYTEEEKTRVRQIVG